ncbi:MAG: DUF2330 domain-containing protein [Deltaproteobacteria bacterium]
MKIASLAAALGLGSLLAVPLSIRPHAAEACATVGRPDIRIAGEEALIVWDAPSHTEHFIRRVEFSNVTGDFGFLVPTPSRPTLSEVPDSLFGSLFDLYRRVVHDPRRATGGRHMRSVAGAVQVVEQVRVAGLDATVLRASDPAALSAWLTAHHYPTTPALTAYLAPYVARDAYVTAFRYQPSGPVFGTRAVEISFVTDRPSYPYAEPTDAPVVANRVFRVSLIASRRMRARLGHRAWSARTGFAGLVDLSSVRSVMPSVPASGWLTTFEEPASVRGRDDLYFEPSPAQTAVPSTIDHRIGATTRRERVVPMVDPMNGLGL